MDEVCSSCFKSNSLRVHISNVKGNPRTCSVCDQPWVSQLVPRTQAGGKAVPLIRRRPSILGRYEKCQNTPCYYELNCTFAHSDEELLHWFRSRVKEHPRLQPVRDAKPPFQMCTNVQRNGHCSYDRHCYFAHSQEELEAWTRSIMQVAKDLDFRLRPKINPSVCYEMCKHKAACTHGISCTFAHSEEELHHWFRCRVKEEPREDHPAGVAPQYRMCMNVENNGYCPYDVRCEFPHSKEELDAWQNVARRPPATLGEYINHPRPQRISDTHNPVKGPNFGLQSMQQLIEATDFKNSFKAALARGSVVEVGIVKCVTLGPPEAGKTQLKSALIDRFECSEESTPMSTGAEVVMQRYIQGDTSWEHLTRDRLCKFLHTTVKMKKFMEPATPDAREMDLLSQASEVEVEQQSSQPTREDSTRAPEEDIKDDRKILQKAFAALKESVERELVKDDPAGVQGLQKVRMIHLIDSGGQPAFFDFHPVIATSRAMYLLVYNMEEGLDAKPRITYERKDFPTKELPNEKQSNLDMIKNSLLTLHDCKEKFIKMEKELRQWFGDSISDSADCVPILVVGSRKKEENIETEGNKLKTECKHLPIWDEVLDCTKTGMKLFPVDSMVKDCPGLQSVREAINEAECLFKLCLPIAWFFCQLIFWSANEDLHVLTYADLQDLCLQEGIIPDGAEFHAMVRTFHLLGIFSFPYFDQELLPDDQWEPDDKPVFTNPDILYREVTKILEVAFRDLEKTKMKSIQKKSLKALQRNGRFTTATLGHLGIPDQLGSYSGFQSYLLQRLVQWGLAAKLTSGTSHGTADDPTPDYFIPSVLTTCNEDPCDFTKSPIPELAFCISHAGSVCNYVPQGMFPHLIVRADGMGYKIPQSADCLFRNAAVLTTEAAPSGYAYNVMVMDRKDRVTIKIDPAHDCKDRFSWDDCCRIVCDFKKAMEAAYYGIYLTPHEVTVGCECQCKKALPSHLAEIIHCPDGHCEMQCLIPTVTWRDDCPEAVAKLYPQAGATENGSQSTKQKQPLLDGAGMMKESQEAEPLSAEGILDLFRKEFLKDVDALAVVGELRQNGIVPQSCQEKVANADGFRQRNEILHDYLKRTCTREALIKACDIIIELAEGGEENNPKMKKVAEDMKKKLGTGK